VCCQSTSSPRGLRFLTFVDFGTERGGYKTSVEIKKLSDGTYKMSTEYTDGTQDSYTVRKISTEGINQTDRGFPQMLLPSGNSVFWDLVTEK
jgi:hypothetical protein